MHPGGHWTSTQASSPVSGGCSAQQLRDLVWVSSCPAESRLASSGALRVNEFLQVEGYSNIYAIGDCADVKEPKMAYHAGLHANIAVTNLVNSLKQRPLKAYRPGKGSQGLPSFQSLGLDGGDFQCCKMTDHQTKLSKLMTETSCSSF